MNLVEKNNIITKYYIIVSFSNNIKLLELNNYYYINSFIKKKNYFGRFYLGEGLRVMKS